MNIAIQKYPSLPAMGRAQPLKAPSSLVDSPVNALVVHEQGRWVSGSDNWMLAINDLGVTADQVSQYFRHVMRLWIKGISFGPPAGDNGSPRKAWMHSAFYGGLDLKESETKVEKVSSEALKECEEEEPAEVASADVEPTPECFSINPIPFMSKVNRGERTLEEALKFLERSFTNNELSVNSLDGVDSLKRIAIEEIALMTIEKLYQKGGPIEPALNFAAEFGFIRVLKKLQELASISTRVFTWSLSEGETLAHIAARSNQAKFLKWLFELLGDHSKYLINRKSHEQETPFTLAVKEGHLEVVHLILASGEVSAHFHSEAVIYAAIEGHLEAVRLLLTRNEILAGTHNLALKHAVEGGHLEIVRLLLLNGEISEDADHYILQWAAKGGQLEIVRFLLERGEISEDTRGPAVVKAAEKGHLRIIQVLLKSGPISGDACNEAFRVAALRGYFKIVQELLAGGDISVEAHDYAVVKAAEMGHLNTVRELLAHGKASAEARSDAIGKAIKKELLKGHFEIIQELLVYGEVSEYIRDYILKAAAEKGRLDIVHKILASGSISKGALNSAFIFAVVDNHLEIVQLLLKSDLILEETRNRSLKLAKESGYLRIVEALLEKGKIPEKAPDNTAIEAAPKGRLDTVSLSLERRETSARSLEELLGQAALDGNVDQVRVLLLSGSISMTTLLRIYRGVRSSRPDCANLILRQLLSQLGISRVFQALSIASLAVMLGGGHWMMQEEEEPESPWYWPFG